MASWVMLWVVLQWWCIYSAIGEETGGDGGGDSVSLAASYNYGDALSKGILFFEGQRSGKLPTSQRVQWRGDSALSDGQLENVNLTGGYYDAGDNVKFVWPMSFSLSLLSWAAVEYPTRISSVNELVNLRGAIKWGTDFLLRAHASSTTLYSQVGDGNNDHQCWERPEDMDTSRTLYKVTSTSPGTEVAADVAAALASASIVFKTVNSSYSAKLLNHSISLFEFADKYRGSYETSCPFYCSYSGYQDELLWAATWLYKATNKSKYLNYLSSNKDWSQSVSEFSWDNKFAGVQTLLAKEFLKGETNLDNYKNGVDSFICALMPGSPSLQIRTTPGGLLYTRDSSNLQYVTSATMVMLIYSGILNSSHVNGVQCGSITFSPQNIKDFAEKQVDYIIGNNPLNMSYMVGLSNKYPTQLHHRGASIPSIHVSPNKVSCNDGYSIWYPSTNPNPNVHVGAIVGGPDFNDQFNDQRTDYSHLEPTTYMNAAFVGSVASLIGGQTTEPLARDDLPCGLKRLVNLDTSSDMVQNT